jgi:hypothetical protein
MVYQLVVSEFVACNYYCRLSMSIREGMNLHILRFTYRYYLIRCQRIKRVRRLEWTLRDFHDAICNSRWWYSICVRRVDFSMALKGAVDPSHLCRYGQVLISECHENCESRE